MIDEKRIVNGSALLLIAALAALGFAACVGDDAALAPSGGGGPDGGSDGTTGAAPRIVSFGAAPMTPTAKVDVEDTFTVSGKIVAGGQPLANLPVVVGNRPATSTSAVGTFTVTGVKPPYDVGFAFGTPASITVYKGLTRKDPTLVAYGDSGPPSPTYRELQMAGGTVSGGPTPYPMNATRITVSGANRAEEIATASPGGVFNMQPTSPAGPVHLLDPTTTIATFHAHATLAGNGYYGKLENVTLSAGNAGGGQNIAMNQVPLVTVGYDVKAPATFTDGAKTRIEQSSARKSASAAASTSLPVTLPDPARPTAPADAITNVTAATAFSFSALAGGVHRVTFYATTLPTITVFTKDTTVNLPDLTPFAVVLPKGTLYTWRVFAYAPLSSLDDPKLAETLEAADGTLPPLVDVRATAATPRVFTTAP